MCFKNWIEGTFSISPKYAFWWKKEYRKLKPRALPRNLMANVPKPSLSLLTLRPLCLPCKEDSAPRCHSTWLICTLQVCSKSFRFLFLLCPTWRNSQAVQTVWRTPSGPLQGDSGDWIMHETSSGRGGDSLSGWWVEDRVWSPSVETWLSHP